MIEREIAQQEEDSRRAAEQEQYRERKMEWQDKDSLQITQVAQWEDSSDDGVLIDKQPVRMSIVLEEGDVNGWSTHQVL